MRNEMKNDWSMSSFLAIIGVIVFLLPTIPTAGAAQPEYGRVVSPFALEDVRLTAGTRLYNQMEANKSFLLSLNNDNILYNFRQTAGLPAPGSSYGGWESSSVELRGHFMGGHLLSALAKLYAGTGDISCKDKADYLVAELKKCQDAMGSGYLSAYPSSVLDRLEANTSFTWAPYYTLHKILAGLIDCYKYCGNTTALGMADDLAAYIKGRMDNLTQAQIDAFLETRPFAWNFYHEHGGVAEALLDLYQITGNANTLTLGTLFDRNYFTDPLANNIDEFGYQEYHMNSHIPMVTAIARQYEVTNDTRYRDAAVNFLNMMINGHNYPTGGASGTSPTHQAGNGEYYGCSNLFYEHTQGNTAESCCAHGLNEIAQKVFTWTADPNYADDYESRFVNAVMSQQNPSNGTLVYYLSVGQGKSKSFDATGQFKCCAGSGVEAFSTLAEGAYYHDGADGLYVNGFVDSTLTWVAKGLALKQTTDFPEEQGTQLQFNLSLPTDISVKLRIPSWATQGVTVQLNGAVQSVNAAPGSYVTLSRTWNDGDVVELSLPFNLRTIKMPDRPDHVAVMYGPQLLVACTSGGAQFNGSESELLSSLTPVAGQPCEFTTTLSSGTVTYKPINRVLYETYNGYTIVANPVVTPVMDYVLIADSISETVHNLQSFNSGTGSYSGKDYRDATNGGWFSYDMQVAPNEPMYVRCTYWGGDSSRIFYIQVDDVYVATEMLENNHPGEFFQLIYPIPTALTNGKSSVTVKLQAKSGNTAGGVFDQLEMLTYNPVLSPPAAPANLTATAGDGSVNLDWNDNSESDLDSYTVYRSTTRGSGYSAIISGLGSSAHTDSSVTNGTTYYYRVTAKDTDSNESANSNEISVTPHSGPDITPPEAPIGLVAAAGDGSVSLDWDDNIEVDLAGYAVYRSTVQGGGGGYTEIASGLSASSYPDNTAMNGTTYYYVISATDASSNESGYSLEASATPTDISITNGDFESAPVSSGQVDVTGWFDTAGDWWNGAGMVHPTLGGASAVSPSSDYAVILGHWDPIGWIYQEIGTKGTGAGVNYTISFDYGQPTDGNTGRYVGLVAQIYQGIFTGADGTDLTGLTLIDSVATPIVNDLALHNFSATLDLSSANTTDPLWLRIGNVDGVAGTDDWVCVDNVSIIPEPGTMPFGAQGLPDLQIFAAQWLKTGCADVPACDGADLDGDAGVTLSDFAILANNWMTE